MTLPIKTTCVGAWFERVEFQRSGMTSSMESSMKLEYLQWTPAIVAEHAIEYNGLINRFNKSKMFVSVFIQGFGYATLSCDHSNPLAKFLQESVHFNAWSWKTVRGFVATLDYAARPIRHKGQNPRVLGDTAEKSIFWCVNKDMPENVIRIQYRSAQINISIWENEQWQDYPNNNLPEFVLNSLFEMGLRPG